MSVQVTIRGSSVNPTTTEEYKLDRQATALRRAGDWDGAIAALRQRKALIGEQWMDSKLAKYLQRAGRFDEAMAEIQWLLDHSHAWSQALSGHRLVSTQLTQRAGYCARIHGAAVLICEREGRTDLAAEHEKRSAAYRSICDRLYPIAQAEEDAKRAAFRARKALHKADSKQGEAASAEHLL